MSKKKSLQFKKVKEYRQDSIVFFSISVFIFLILIYLSYMIYIGDTNFESMGIVVFFIGYVWTIFNIIKSLIPENIYYEEIK